MQKYIKRIPRTNRLALVCGQRGIPRFAVVKQSSGTVGVSCPGNVSSAEVKKRIPLESETANVPPGCGFENRYAAGNAKSAFG
jgi:hypothetical protein